MEQLRRALTREVGPLPVWGWLLALVGGLVAGLYFRRAFGAGYTAEPDGDQADLEPVEPFAPGDDPAGAVVLGGTGPTVSQPSPITTNDEWRRAGLARLVSENYGALAADRALGRYLAESQLTPAEEAMIQRVLELIGPPPDPPGPPLPRPDPPAERRITQLSNAALLDVCEIVHGDKQGESPYRSGEVVAEIVRRLRTGALSINNPRFVRRPGPRPTYTRCGQAVVTAARPLLRR